MSLHRAYGVFDEADETQGLGDIIANLMALFILLTVFVLLARVTSNAAEASIQSLSSSASGTFLPKSIEPIEQRGAVVVVTESGFGVVDLPAIFNALLPLSVGNEVDLVNGLFKGGSAEQPHAIRREQRPEGDHRFSLRYSFQIDQVPNAGAIKETDPVAVLSMLRERLSVSAPFDFFIFPDGMEQFVPVYRVLNAQGICFRWQSWTRTTAAWTDQPNPVTFRGASLLARPGCPAT